MTQILNRSATAGLFKGLKVVDVAIDAGAGATAVSVTDAELKNGLVIGAYYKNASADADAWISDVALTASTGALAVRLSGASTAAVVVRVVVAIASGDIA